MHLGNISNLCNASSQENNQINKHIVMKMALNSQTVRATENPQLSQGGPSQRQTSDLAHRRAIKPLL